MPPIRVLIVEDNPLRLQRLQAWVPDVNFVWAKSAGMALGILERDRGAVYYALMLDHDLDTSAVVPSDRSMDGRDVVASVIRNMSTATPVLVHSTNREYAAVMVERLQHAGFYVEHISMNDLTKARLKEFLAYAKDVWDHPSGGISDG